MAATQRQIPGGPFINDPDLGKQRQIPGGPMFIEGALASGGGEPPPGITLQQVERGHTLARGLGRGLS